MKSANTIIDECRELLSKEDKSMIEIVNEGVVKKVFLINKKYEKFGIMQIEGIDVVHSNLVDNVDLWYFLL